MKGDVKVRLRHNRYWVDYHFNGGRIRYPVADDSKAANAIAARIRLELAEGTHTGERVETNPAPRASGGDRTFKAVAEEFLRKHADRKRSASFYDFTVRVLNRHFGGQRIEQITTKDVDAFLAARYAEVRPATANRSVRVLKMVFAKAIRWGYVHRDKNPTADVRLEREENGREVFLTKEEADRLVAECPAWLRPVVVTALYTGGRRGEVLALRWEDVDFKARRVTFRKTKNSEVRHVPMSRRLEAALTEIPSRFLGGLIFRDPELTDRRPDDSEEPARLKVSRLEWAFEQAAKRAKLYREITEADGTVRRELAHFHDLRHTYASWQVQQGTPLNNVRALLGHKSLTMTLRYAHLAPGHLQDAADVLDRIDAGSVTGSVTGGANGQDASREGTA